MTSLSIHPASAAPDLPGQRLAFGDRRLMLDCGAELSGVTLAYQACGALNAEKSNAILVCHALTGDQFAAGRRPIAGKPGWWQVTVGPGRPIVRRP
jgi:homoserine O-acetyltransferase